MRKLPVFKTVGEVLSGVTTHYFQLLIAAWPAILLWAAAVGMIVWVSHSPGVAPLAGGMPGASESEKRQAIEALFSAENSPKLAAFGVLYILGSAIAAVRWHRLVLFGEGTGTSFGRVRPLRREDGTYLWTIIKIYLAWMTFLIVVGTIFLLLDRLTGTGGLGSLNFVLILVALYGYCWAFGANLRLMLALPDAALGLGGRLGFVFHASVGNSWRLLGAVFITGILMVLAFTVTGFFVGLFAQLAQRMGWGGSTLATVFGFAVQAAIYIFFMMSQITLLSVAYREIVGLPSSPESEAAHPA
ncbi:MAG: hypothetical protein P4L72_16785 [Parvibaculum sp.]|uniref:hypothetical protein n=1 Tax=Parvibaculum sp. TaxID=2024848 RepID=UPI00284B8E6D|nr:hypothetical protein [Parvibaculum sp.]MDR3500873.1 hypothetical protein [Parvibaculum sp.]